MTTHLRLLTALLVLTPSLAAAGWSDGLFAQPTHDFGAVPRGSKQVHQFVLVNTTGRTVGIAGVSVSCNCTRVQAPQRVIPPGGSAAIEAVMDTTGFLGPKAVTVYVQFDQPQRRRVSLRVVANSIGNLAAAGHGASEIDFGILPEGAGGKRTLRVERPGDGTWRVTDLDYGSRFVAAEMREISRGTEGTRYELAVAVAEDAPIGRLEDTLRIHTSNPEQPLIPIRLVATVEPKIAVMPPTLRIAGAQPGQKVRQRFLIKAPEPFTVQRVDNTDGVFEVLSSQTPKTMQILEVTLTVPADPAEVTDHLDIVTSLTGDQIVRLPVQR